MKETERFVLHPGNEGQNSSGNRKICPSSGMKDKTHEEQKICPSSHNRL